VIENPQHSSPLFEVRELSCEREGHVLFRKLGFSLDRGEILQVRGSNGAGKTSLLRIVCGLDGSHQGELRWQGVPLASCIDDFHSELLYIGHRLGVNQALTPLENLRWSCRLHDRVGDGEIRDALAELGLASHENLPCRSLSAGQQQRVSLARLLLRDAPLWVLDEPFASLDAAGIALLEKLLLRHSRSGGAAMVTTHHVLGIPCLRVLTLGLPQ